jgi:CHAT domain-containing protein
LQYQQGRLTEAEKSLASAILAAERELSSLNHRWDRELWNRHNRPVYALLVQLELDRGDQNRAFALWLWYQSAAERNVIESRSALKTYAANNIDLDELQHLFRIQLPEFKTARNGYDTAFFYAVLPKQVAIWVSQNGAIRFSTPKAGIDKLQRLSAQLVEECSTPASSVTLIRAHARELYSLLIGASHEQLTSSKLLIVPDDFLFSVPFNVLIGPDGRYLGTKVPIVIVLHGGSRDTHLQPSIRTANTVVASSATTPDIRVALAGVNEEAAVVQSKLKNAIVVSGESASAERMEELLTRATLFHFAGHSLASQGELNLVLPGRVNEPYTLFPISRLAPAQMRKCHLVVLSACSTLGLDHGIHRNSYTGVGLFLRAGAQFVVASRWNIDSVRTIEYMSRFYSSLHTNADVAVAMRNAQTYTDSVSDHPYYWAPFGVFGAYERLL